MGHFVPTLVGVSRRYILKADAQGFNVCARLLFEKASFSGPI